MSMPMDVRGKHVALTGTFVSLKRAVAERALAARGAHIAKSITRTTDLVFVGRDAGSKLDEARARGLPVYDEAALVAVLASAGGGTERGSTGAQAFHAGFDALVRELEAHPRVQILGVWRGEASTREAVVAAFAKGLRFVPSDEIQRFYAERDGCALLWADAERVPATGGVYARHDAFPSFARLEDLDTTFVHAIAMPPLAQVFGPLMLDYANPPSSQGTRPAPLYPRSFVGFDFPGMYFTPAFVIDGGVVRVQMGDDHGVFDDGRPTVDFATYVGAVLATRGSVHWRAQLFGFSGSPETREARRDPLGYFAANPLSIDALLGPPSAEREVQKNHAEALERALPHEPRLRALVLAVESTTQHRTEPLPDGRVRIELERPEGGRQIAFLRRDEHEALEASLRARARLR